MKTVAAMIAGLLLSILTFVGGLVAGSVYLAAGDAHHVDGLDATVLWTSKPVKIDRAPQSFERLGARPANDLRQTADAGRVNTDVNVSKTSSTQNDQEQAQKRQAALDPIITSSINPVRSGMQAYNDKQQVAHMQWCSRRYRSYNSNDNSYRPFRGGRRACQSPYSADLMADLQPVDSENDGVSELGYSENSRDAEARDGKVERVSWNGQSNMSVTRDHIRACERRYRSYRQEDNTYQPSSGGPRRSCD